MTTVRTWLGDVFNGCMKSGHLDDDWNQMQEVCLKFIGSIHMRYNKLLGYSSVYWFEWEDITCFSKLLKKSIFDFFNGKQAMQSLSILCYERCLTFVGCEKSAETPRTKALSTLCQIFKKCRILKKSRIYLSTKKHNFCELRLFPVQTEQKGWEMCILPFFFLFLKLCSVHERGWLVEELLGPQCYNRL